MLNQINFHVLLSPGPKDIRVVICMVCEVDGCRQGGRSSRYFNLIYFYDKILSLRHQKRVQKLYIIRQNRKAG